MAFVVPFAFCLRVNLFNTDLLHPGVGNNRNSQKLFHEIFDPTYTFHPWLASVLLRLEIHIPCIDGGFFHTYV